MILVVNPNPAVDKVAVVDFARGSTLRPRRVFEWPGGSGVHAAHVARLLGADVRVLCPVGGLQGERFLRLACADGLAITPVPVDAETRGTYSVLDAVDGNVCDIADPGETHLAADAAALLARAEELVPEADLVVVSGSVPRGWPDEVHTGVVRLGRAAGVRVVADLTGDCLRGAVREQPWLVKPSLEELRRDHVVGPTPAAVLDLVAGWIARGVQNVCLSLAGSGVLWFSPGGVFRVGIAPRDAYNTIGSGDTLVGAVAARTSGGASLEDALRWGVAAATSNLDYAEPGHCDPVVVGELVGQTFVEEPSRAFLEHALGEGAAPG